MRATVMSKRLLYVMAMVVAFGMGFGFGMNRGYTEGFNASLNATSADAMIIATVLNLIGSEDLDHAELALDAHLDSLLLHNSIGRHVSPIVLQRWVFPDLQATIDRLAAEGARYRLDNPRLDVDPDLQGLVEDAAHDILERRDAVSH